MSSKILVTGGAGFVGSNLAALLKREFPQMKVTALDNLKRRGSELAVERFRRLGIGFLHGDVRCPDDMAFFNERIDKTVLETLTAPAPISSRLNFENGRKMAAWTPR